MIIQTILMHSCCTAGVLLQYIELCLLGQQQKTYSRDYIQMREVSEHPESEDSFKVAPLISEDKLEQLKYKVLSTLLGLATIGHLEHSEAMNSSVKTKTIAVAVYFLLPVLVIVPSSIIVDWKLHALAVLIPTLFNPAIALLFDCMLNSNKHVHKYLATAVYSYIWSVHFYICRQLVFNDVISGSTYAAILILSIVSVLTSSSTIAHAAVRQFSASTFHYQELSVHSTLYCRMLVPLPLLLTQLALYYGPETGVGFAPIIVLQFIVSLSFVLWFMGWISSLYNNLIFVVNNLLNCLVFGEQASHSGTNYRGTNMRWVSLVSVLLNIIAIGLNILLVLTMKEAGQINSKIVECQHILLMCLASATSLITAAVYYLGYRCFKQNNSLIRLNKFGFHQTRAVGDTRRQTYKGRLFLGHRQILTVLVNCAIPPFICLTAVFVFGEYYDAYCAGTKYSKQTNFKAEKVSTIVLLAVDVGCYLCFMIFKEITRVRSKVGCSVNPCCFNLYYVEIERDMFMNLVLKVTGALAVMALVLRVQNLEVFSSYILSKSPRNAEPHVYIQFFISLILFPVLVYRSYKRSQNFSHFFHISIIVALLLTIANSTLYVYQSIFVVLAFPNFPENPFRLLLLSPFFVPKKLEHKQENIYRIAYLAVNLFSLLIYIATLGTLEFTSVFGLPMYWCVIPSINCQSNQRLISTAKSSDNQMKVTMSDFETTNQGFELLRSVNRSTPEHNLYEKIVEQVPFYIFRNKRPGYYLLRIDKYILLVEVIFSFGGMFETVSLVGLETQEVTTCHAKEGETIDRIVDYNWSDNSQNVVRWACDDTLKTVIHEEHFLRNVKFTTENEIQLTGVIQSSEFYEQFKKCLIRSIIYHYNKMLKRNPNNQLSSQQTKEAQILLDDLQDRLTKQKIDALFPYSFMERESDLIFQAKYRDLSPSKIIIKKKLPPIKKDEKQKKDKIIDDFADLIGGASNTSDMIQTSIVEDKQRRIDIDKTENLQVKANDIVPEEKKDAADLHMAAIVSAYLCILGKFNYLNTDMLYKMIKQDNSALAQFKFQSGSDLVASSIGCALKIAIGKQLMGQQQIKYSDFVEYDKNEYLGILESTGFSEAVQKGKEDIWTLSYNQPRKSLTVKRLAKSQTSLYMFSFETNAVQAVWNNLRFEILFAANDNDERYSIQTHPYLLRNLLVEGCEEPYGYAGYYSQQFLNL